MALNIVGECREVGALRASIEKRRRSAPQSRARWQLAQAVFPSAERRVSQNSARPSSTSADAAWLYGLSTPKSCTPCARSAGSAWTPADAKIRARRRDFMAAHDKLESVQQVDAGVLNVAYEESGPPDGTPVLLLHGFPYDIHAFDAVAASLAAAGCRVIVPFVRGYGPTRFLLQDTPRSGQQAVLAHDTLALMGALKIEKAILAGFDWGSR